MIALIASLLGVGGVAGAVLHFFGVAGVKKAAGKIPPKVWLFIAIAIALGLAVWFIDRRGYQRAEEQERVHKLERQELTRAVVAAIDGDIDRKLAAIATATSTKIQTIDTEGRTVVQPIITRELVRDPRLAAPGSCLTPGLLSAVNAARGYLDDRLAGGAEPGSANPPTVPGSPARR